MKQLLWAGIALLMVVLAWAAPAAARAGRPNIVLIFFDDLGYGDLGCFGAQGWKTPHIDSLAAGGRRFTDFYVAQAVCSASRAALLTGCYPNRVGIAGALGPAQKVGLSTNETTLARLCRQAGYATAAFGKWHLGDRLESMPLRHGFDEYFGLPYSNDMWPYNPDLTNNKFPELPLYSGERMIGYVRDQSLLSTWYTERAVDFIERRRGRPFFLYLAHSLPHVPLAVSDRHRGTSAQGLYGDVIQELDWSVGQVLTALDRHGLRQDTLVILTSDNGPWMTYGNHAGSPGPLRGSKGTSWEGGVRVPCVMRWPGKIPAGTVCREPAMTIDLLPTVAALLGQPLPGHQIDGRDIGKLISGQPGSGSQRPYFFYYSTNCLEAVRLGRWKLHFPHPWREDRSAPGQDGQRGKPRTLTTGLELYDLEKDPAETTDLATAHPEVLQTLQTIADTMRTELGDSLTHRRGNGTRPPQRWP